MIWVNIFGIFVFEFWYEYGCGYESLLMSQVNEVVFKFGQSFNIIVFEYVV